MIIRGILRTALAALCVTCAASAASVSGVDPVDSLLNDGHAKKARTIVEQRLKSNPNDARTLFYWSRVQFAFDHQDAAREYGEKAVEADPQVPEYHIHLGRLYGWLTEDAPLLRQYSLVKSLKRELDAAQALNPKQLDGMLVRAVFLTVAPSMVGGDKKQADAIIGQMIAINPERGYIARARVAAKVKDYGKMENSYRKALDANGESYAAVIGLADLYSGPMASTKLSEAERYAKRAIQLDPSRGAGFAALARSYAAQQRWDDLEKSLIDAERSVPEDISAYFAAAERLQQDGRDFDRVEKYIQKYQSREREGDAPAQFQALYVLALAHEGQGKRDIATTELTAALKLRPDWDLAKKELKRLR